MRVLPRSLLGVSMLASWLHINSNYNSNDNVKHIGANVDLLGSVVDYEGCHA